MPGAGEILRRTGRSMFFGDVSAVGGWEGDPRVELHGPGYSKLLIGEDLLAGDAWMAARRPDRRLDCRQRRPVVRQRLGRMGRQRRTPSASPTRSPPSWRTSCRARQTTSRRRWRRLSIRGWPSASRRRSTAACRRPGAREVTLDHRPSPRLATLRRQPPTCSRRSSCATRPSIRSPIASSCSRSPPLSPSVPTRCARMPQPMGKTLVVTALTRDRALVEPAAGVLARRSAQRRRHPDQSDGLGSAARRQPVRASLRASIVPAACRRSAGRGRRRVRILSFTGGAGQMYCGSCLRDNALAAALLARGHDVVLTPVYTPTRTDERNVSRAQVFFGGISVFLEQQVPLFRHTPRVFDRLWDAPWVIRLATKRQIKVDPSSLGEMTVSMLRGERGFQAKEIAKLLEWLRTEPRFDVINLPYALLLGLAEPLRRELKAPICCTLQGEDLFLDGLGARVPQRVDGADSRRDGARRRVPAGERVLPRLHDRLSRHPAREDAARAARHQHGRVPRRVPPPRNQPFTDRLSRENRAGEGPAHALRGLPGSARTHAGTNRRAWWPQGICRRSTSPISRKSAARCANGDSKRSSTTGARSIARRRRPSCSR